MIFVGRKGFLPVLLALNPLIEMKTHRCLCFQHNPK